LRHHERQQAPEVPGARHGPRQPGPADQHARAVVGAEVDTEAGAVLEVADLQDAGVEVRDPDHERTPGRQLMNRRSMRMALAGAVLSLTVMVSGCMSGGIQSIPLPGGVDTGSNPRTYKIQFDDVLDLVPQSMVKQNGIPVGRVTKVEVPKDAWYAQVTVQVKNSVDLSDKAEASVQQTNLLG